MNITHKLLISTLIFVVIVAAISIITVRILTSRTESAGTLIGHKESDTLISVQVVFRHGARTPAYRTLYPADPYKNYSFYPDNESLGGLTYNGRKESYLLGKALRRRYKDFLGEDNFYPGIVKSFTSDYDRSHMTLQCVLAGLFPRKNSMLSPWRPITYDSVEFSDDNVIGIMANCRTLATPETRPTDNDTIKLFDYISIKSGATVDTYFSIIYITNAFDIESSFGLELPDWGKPLYPEPLLKYSHKGWLEWVKLNYRYGVAGLVQQITQNALNVIANLNDYYSEKVNTKIVLFSGHDYNLQFLLYILRVEQMWSMYNAHIIFELHKMNGIYGFKIFYNNEADGKMIALQVPFCKNSSEDEMFCPLDIFIWNTEWYYEPTPSCPSF